MSLLEQVSIHAWIQNNGIRTESGEVLDFKKYKFMFDIYADRSPLITCMKCAQIGFTTYEILKTAHECKNEKIDILYVLPTADDVKRFSGGKTNKMIAQNPVLQEWTTDKDSIEQKQFGSNTIYYQGCVDDITEILTTSGWKKYNEISIGESLPTININTKEVEIDTVLDLTIFETDQEVLHLKNDAVDALVTKDHRCVVHNRSDNTFSIVHAHQLQPNSRQSLPMATKGIQINQSKFTDAFVEMLGWVIAEGSYWTAYDKSRFVRKDGTINPTIYESPRVVIIQKKTNGINEIRRILKEANLNYFEKKKKDGCTVFQLDYATSKLIKSIIPTKELTFDLVNSISRVQMEKLVTALINGDGHTTKTGFQTFIQRSNKTIDAFQYLIALIGKGSTVRFRTKINSFSRNKIGEISIKTSKNIHKYSIQPVQYKGIMWCPTTTNGTIFTRRNGKVWITGQSWTERAALMITAKKLVVDEYDRCKQDIVEQYDSRLQSIANPKKAFFSNPSIPDFGVHKWYLKSDQKKWHVTHSCNETFVMDENCIDYTHEIYRCPSCKSEINSEEVRGGQWLPTAKGEWSGYWIPLWIAPWMSAKDISKMKREKTQEFFDNFVAGRPFFGSGNKVMPETIYQNVSQIVNDQSGTIIIGVDTGLPIHYVIGNKQGIFYYGKCDDYDTLENYLKRWDNAIIVSDQGGDLIGIRKLQEKYPSRVFLCYYRADRKTQRLIDWGQGGEYGKVTADRNRLMQLVIDELGDKRITLCGKREDYDGLVEHFGNIYRTKTENALGIMEYKWERTGADHWVHSLIYWRIGMDKYSESMAEVVGSDIFAGLPIGRFFD